MIDPQLQQFVQEEVKKQLESFDRLNAKGTKFQQNTGLTVQGQNVQGLFGDKILHTIFRLSPTYPIISGGEIVCTSSSMLIDTEGGAASDDLDTILPGTLVTSGEEIILIRAADDAHSIVIKHNTGNLILEGGADTTFSSQYFSMLLRYDFLNKKWVEISRMDS